MYAYYILYIYTPECSPWTKSLFRILARPKALSPYKHNPNLPDPNSMPDPKLTTPPTLFFEGKKQNPPNHFQPTNQPKRDYPTQLCRDDNTPLPRIPI